MTLWAQVMRRAASLTPELAMRILAAFATLRDKLTDAELQRAVDLGYINQIVDQIVTEARFQAAMQPVRDAMRRSIIQSVATYARALPVPPQQARELVVAFDYLSPDVIAAIRTLETRVMTSLKDDARETVRAFVEQGLRDGVNPREIARGIRSVIGLGPSQLQEVENFRDALLGRNGRSVADYTARNRTVDRLLAKGKLTDAQVERYVDLYRKKRIALNAETVARTAALDAQKAAQQLAWQQAVDKGIVDGHRLRKQWIGVMDSRERPTHVAMEKETAPWNQPYSNGQMVPGDTEYNCRCISRYYVAPA